MKLSQNELSNIISPFKEFNIKPYGTPFKPRNLNNIYSPENNRLFSPMNSK
jgi:hypothetical protein